LRSERITHTVLLGLFESICIRTLHVSIGCRIIRDTIPAITDDSRILIKLTWVSIGKFYSDSAGAINSCDDKCRFRIELDSTVVSQLSRDVIIVGIDKPLIRYQLYSGIYMSFLTIDN
jgi:hypothetical protein